MIDRSLDSAWLVAYLHTNLGASTLWALLVLLVLFLLTRTTRVFLFPAAYGLAALCFLFVLVTAGFRVWNSGDVVVNGELVPIENALCASRGGDVGLEQMSSSSRIAYCQTWRHGTEYVVSVITVQGRRVIADRQMNVGADRFTYDQR